MDHVIVVVMENKDITQAISAPYTRSLINAGTAFSNSFAITHPSQPNYLALWAGSTMGVTSDLCPPPGSPYGAENLGHACEAAGLTWRAYSENLPAVGYNGCTSSGTLYTRKHDPWVDFNNLDHTNERPYTDLAGDIGANMLPNLAFVIPNNCDNSHDNGCTVAYADAWLSNNLPAMRNAVGPNGLVVLTWDEDNGSSLNQILTLFVGDSVKAGYISNTHITHYTLLRTICDALGLPSFGAATGESPVPDVWLDPHTITATSGPNGAISPTGVVTVLDGDSPSFAITPDPHYHVADVQVDGASVGAVTSYTFEDVTADHTIAASFAIDTHTLTVDVQGSGSVDVQPLLARYDYGTTVQLTALPAAGWVFQGWGGDASGAANPRSLVMDADKAVTATFALLVGFDFKPHDLDLNSKDKWVTGYLTPPAPYAASQIDVPSLRLNGVVAVSGDVAPKIEEHGTRLKVKFARADVKPTLVPGDHVPVTVTGTIAGQALTGTDEIKVKAPKLHAPKAGDQLVAGATVPVTWDAPPGAASVTLLSSLDDGVTWSVAADNVPNTGAYDWRVPSTSSNQARLEIMAVYDVDETGIIPESEFAASDPFTIATSTAVGGGPAVFALRCPNPVTGRLQVSFSLAEAGAATLSVYDVSGRLVLSHRAVEGPGWHTVALGDLPSGVFLVRLSEGARRLSSRVAVMR